MNIIVRLAAKAGMARSVSLMARAAQYPATSPRPPAASGGRRLPEPAKCQGTNRKFWRERPMTKPTILSALLLGKAVPFGRPDTLS
ncbi:hypothetical protein, partial [Azospirillum sp. B506]|uniref:hypothetical protein n=1 Tax=Azospirillum sp. B506 TaxID=137721 RepID=UPI001B3BBB4D